MTESQTGPHIVAHCTARHSVCYRQKKNRVNPLMGTLKPQSNGPLYNKRS